MKEIAALVRGKWNELAKRQIVELCFSCRQAVCRNHGCPALLPRSRQDGRGLIRSVHQTRRRPWEVLRLQLQVSEGFAHACQWWHSSFLLLVALHSCVFFIYAANFTTSVVCEFVVARYMHEFLTTFAYSTYHIKGECSIFTVAAFCLQVLVVMPLSSWVFFLTYQECF